MADGKITIDTRLERDGIKRGINDIQRELRKLDASFLKTAAISTAIVLSPSLSPMIAGATVGVMGLASSFAAAGIGAVAFGAVAVSVLGDLFEAQEEVAALEAKIANASTAEERIEAQKELNALVKGMGDSQRYALKELEEFKSFWEEFTKQFEDPIFDAFGLTLSIVKNLFIGMQPAITNVAAVLVEFLELLDQDIANGGFAKFFTWLEINAAESMRNWFTIVSNLLSGFFNLLYAFAPIGASMEEGLVRLTERFKNWASQIENSKSFHNFVNYVKENGPRLMELIGHVIGVIVDLGKALAPAGAVMLEVLNNILKAIRDKVIPVIEDAFEIAAKFAVYIIENWPMVRETVIGLATAVGSFYLILKTLQFVAVITKLLAAYRAGTLMATLAQMGLNTAMLLSPITWLVAGIAAIIAAGVLLYRNWDTVSQRAHVMWAAIKAVFNNIKSTITSAIAGVVSYIASAVSKITSLFSGIRIRLPRIPLPHFSIKGSFDLMPPGLSVPRLSVNWYKDGGVFAPNSPRLIGIGDASVPEAAIPLKPSVLGMIGQKIADTMGPRREEDRKPQPARLTLVLGGTEYNAFVEDITEHQDRKKYRLKKGR